MADEGPPEPKLTQRLVVTRSEAFKLLYSNFFRIRVGPGECIITFGSVNDVPEQLVNPAATSIPPNVVNFIQEEFAVALTWPVMKTLIQQLTDVLIAAEKETGTVRAVKSIFPSEKMIERYGQLLSKAFAEDAKS